MTDKQIIIDDQRKTIHRLQDECTEKTNAIIALGERLDQLKAENNLLRQTHKTEQDRRRAYENALIEIKEIVFPKNQLIITDSPIILKIQEKISECEVK